MKYVFLVLYLPAHVLQGRLVFPRRLHILVRALQSGEISEMDVLSERLRQFYLSYPLCWHQFLTAHIHSCFQQHLNDGLVTIASGQVQGRVLPGVAAH